MWDGVRCFGSLIVVHLLVQVLRMGSLLDGEVFFSFNFVYLIFLEAILSPKAMDGLRFVLQKDDRLL